MCDADCAACITPRRHCQPLVRWRGDRRRVLPRPVADDRLDRGRPAVSRRGTDEGPPMRTIPWPLACGLCLALVASGAQASRYVVENIGHAMPGAQVVPLAINGAGIGAGNATLVDSGVQNAVLLARG